MGTILKVKNFIDTVIPKPVNEFPTTWINKSIDVEVECEDINFDLTKFNNNQSLIYESIK